MRIGLDIRPLQAETRYRGIGMALQELIEALARSYEKDSDSFILYVDANSPIPAIAQKLNHATLVPVKSTFLARLKYVRAFLPAYAPVRPAPGSIDVLLQYDASLGVPRNIPTVVVFHDLIPYLFREQEKRLPARGLRRLKASLAGALYWRKYLKVLQQYDNAAHIIAISEHSKRDIINFSRTIKDSDVTVIHHGMSESFAIPSKPSAIAKRMSDRPYLLYVGGIDIRKNIVGLLRQFYALKSNNPELRLICVGKEFTLEGQLRDLGWHALLDTEPEYRSDVLLPGFVSDSDLAYLYQHAICFVMPSRYEGFGLPILEAMRARCPVVTYDNSSLPEVAGSAALMVADGDSMVSAIQSLIDNPALRRKLVVAGEKQVSHFKWDNTGKATMAVLHETGRHA